MLHSFPLHSLFLYICYMYLAQSVQVYIPHLSIIIFMLIKCPRAKWKHF